MKHSDLQIAIWNIENDTKNVPKNQNTQRWNIEE